jgi:hypothetical protein
MKNEMRDLKIFTWFLILLLPTLSTGCEDKAANQVIAPSSERLAASAPSNTGLNDLGRGPAPVLLGSAGDFVILARTSISTVGNSKITGNIGLSPAAADSITGFVLSSPPTSFATSAQVDGEIFAADYFFTTPADLTMFVDEMLTAYEDASARVPQFTEVGAGIIGGMTLSPGIYKWTTAVLIPSDITLKGGPNDVWVFQIGQGLTQSSAASIKLNGGARAKNIFWQVAGAVEIGAEAHTEGVILTKSSITMGKGASANSRLLAQTRVNLNANVVTEPSL